MVVPEDLGALIPSWELHLRAARKSSRTIDTYRKNVNLFLAWCEKTGTPAVADRRTVTAYLATVTESSSGSTARARLVALRNLSRWLVKEEEADRNELMSIEMPKIDEYLVDPFTTDELAAILRACEGRRFMDRRDTAIVRMLIDFGGRATEVVDMGLAEVDPMNGVATVHGKGGKDRLVPLGDQTCTTLDRYLRMRRQHPLASSERLWLGQRGDNFGYSALWKTLKMRAADAEVDNCHPHRFRHTFADRWLDAGGSEGGLMGVAGWSDYAMVRRYSKARAQRRALGEAKKLNLGDI